MDLLSQISALLDCGGINEKFIAALNSLGAKIADRIDCEKFFVHLFDEQDDKLQQVCPSKSDLANEPLAQSQYAFVKQVLDNGEPYLNNNCEKMVSLATKSSDLRSVLCYPLVKGHRRLGTLLFLNKRGGNKFTHKDKKFVAQLAQILTSIIYNAVLLENSERMSIIDDLTKLYNYRYLRQFLSNEVKRALRYKSKVSLLFIDIDDFKKVNDRYGHLTGSQTLAEVGRVLKSNVRESDIVARYGGDEFIIVLPETPLEGALAIADRIRHRIASYRFGSSRNLQLSLTVSIGIANCPEHALAPESLIEKADTAMYEGKAISKNTVKVASL